MTIPEWLADNLWDKSKLKRAERELDEAKTETRRKMTDARKRHASVLDIQNLWNERNHEESLALEWVETILSNQTLRQVRRLPIEIPSRTNTKFWRENNDLERNLTPYGRQQLNRLVRIERRQELHLRLQVAMATTGVLGTAVGLASVLLQLT